MQTEQMEREDSVPAGPRREEVDRGSRSEMGQGGPHAVAIREEGEVG